MKWASVSDKISKEWGGGTRAGAVTVAIRMMINKTVDKSFLSSM